MTTPVRVEVISPMLSSQVFGCRGCGLVLSQTGIRTKHHDASCDELPEQWKESGVRAVECVKEIQRLYKHQIHVRVIDALTPLGLWKQIRHRLFRVPAFVVDGKLTCAGASCENVEALIDRRLQELSASPDTSQ